MAVYKVTIEAEIEVEDCELVEDGVPVNVEAALTNIIEDEGVYAFSEDTLRVLSAIKVCE